MIRFDTFVFWTQVHFSLALKIVYQMRFVAWVYFSGSIVTIMCTKKKVVFPFSFVFCFFACDSPLLLCDVHFMCSCELIIHPLVW